MLPIKRLKPVPSKKPKVHTSYAKWYSTMAIMDNPRSESTNGTRYPSRVISSVPSENSPRRLREAFGMGGRSRGSLRR